MSLMLRSGALPAGARPTWRSAPSGRRSAPTRFAPASRRRSAACCWSRCSCWSTTSCRASTRSSRWSLNLVILLGFMALHRRRDDAARHRRLHPDDRHGRRLERADLRAHQGGAAAGKGARAAVDAGFDRVFLTILDTHVASLISAAFLFQFGTGPIRGFATTLFFGLLANVFTAVFVSRTLFELVLSRSSRPPRFSRR